LNREDLSARLEDDPSEMLNDRARPLVSEPVRPSTPITDLNNELLSTKPEAVPSELLRDLNSDALSAKPEARVSELLRDLNSEDRSAKVEDEPIEALKNTV